MRAVYRGAPANGYHSNKLIVQQLSIFVKYWRLWRRSASLPSHQDTGKGILRHGWMGWAKAGGLPMGGGWRSVGGSSTTRLA